LTGAARRLAAYKRALSPTFAAIVISVGFYVIARTAFA
jgi:hypothetical protein